MLTVKKGDRFPFLETVLKNAEGPIDLTTAASVKVILKNAKSGAVIEGLCTFPVPASGNTIYKWQAGDTSVPGEYEVEYLITWPEGLPERVPNEGTLMIKIEESLT